MTHTAGGFPLTGHDKPGGRDILGGTPHLEQGVNPYTFGGEKDAEQTPSLLY